MESNPFLQEMMDFDASLLGGAEISGELRTPITEYTPHSVMLDFIRDNQNSPPVKINPKKLSKYGRAINDQMEDYLKAENIPSSGFKEVLKNPANFFYYLNDRKRVYQPEKSHFKLGTFIHMAFLEPKLFKKVKTEPTAILSTTKGCKDLCEFYYKVNRDKRTLDFDSMKIGELRDYISDQRNKCKFLMVQEEDMIIIDILRRNYELYAGGIIPKIMKGALIETSFYGVDVKTGLKVKVRPDAINVKANIGVNAIISFKSSASESFNKFVSDTARFQYELSEGMYQEVVSGITGENFDCTIMVMFQTVAPYQVAVLWWSPEDLQNGKYKYRYAVDTAKECLERNIFPGYESLAEEGNEGIILFNQPKWANKVLSPVELDN